MNVSSGADFTGGSAQRAGFLAGRPIVAGAFLALMLLLGGSSATGTTELACELLAAMALAGWVLIDGEAPTRPAGLLALPLLFSLPVVAQLVPLPPSLWQALPGREAERAMLALVGLDQTWRPLSLTPHATLASLIGLVPPLLALWFCATLPPGRRRGLLFAIAGVALLSVVVGAGQLASGPGGPLHFYSNEITGQLLGFQANRNVEADVLLIGLLAIAAIHRGWRGNRGAALDVAAIVSGALIVLGVVLTGSRTGIALLPLVLAFALAIAGMRPIPFRRRVMLGLAGIGAIAVAFAGLLRNDAIGRVLARFEFTDEARIDIWKDTWFALQQYWPVGSGMGSFAPVHDAAERIEAVNDKFIGHADNELLQLGLEGGLLVLGCWLMALLLVSRRARLALQPTSPIPREQALFAIGAIVVAGLHSLVESNFHSIAFACLVGTAAGMLLVPERSGSRSSSVRAKEES